MTEEWKESEIREAIRKRYRQVSGFAHGCFKYPTGREAAVNLGYDPAIIESAPGKVGERGSVDGIDMTPEMVAAARTNCEGAGLTNVTVQECSSEELPFDDCSFDVVISNGVINLSPRKNETFREIWRVLKPEGRLQFPDIVLDEDLPEEKVGSLEAWTD